MTFAEGLAFKAYEIEELADVYFFRPLGWVIASGARVGGLSPNAVSVLAGLIGAAGGALLVRPSRGLLAFGLLIAHGIFDSADGQLARMTGQTSPLGRVLDGLAGYVTYLALLPALAWGLTTEGGGPTTWVWMGLAALSIAVHAQLYDYHRTAYASWAIKGKMPVSAAMGSGVGPFQGVVTVYEGAQRVLAGRHADVERALAARVVNGRIDERDRERYRQDFYWPVRGWNLFGDNTRFYAIGGLALAGRLDLFFAFVLLPLNVACLVAWLWQARADARFLGRL